MSLVFNMLSRFVIAVFPRSKYHFISWLWSQSAVILEPKKINLSLLPLFPLLLPWSDGTTCHDLNFLNAEFQASFFTLLFHPHQEVVYSSSLSPIRVVSSSYLRLLVFPLGVLIPACDLSNPAFLLMYSAYKLNKHGDKIQPWCIPFLILNQSVVPCLALIVSSWPVYRFLRRQVKYSGIPISLRIFQFVVVYTVKGFRVVNETKVDVFLEFPCFLYDPTNIGSLISGSSASLKPSLYIWKFSVHILLKPSLKDSEHKFASMWNEHSCLVIWTFFCIAFLWD